MATASTDTVSVACKHPNGIRLDVFDIVGKDPRDGSNVTLRVQGPTLRGTSYNRDPEHVAKHGVPVLVGGYAITEGIPASLWERWTQENADSALLADRVLFALPKVESVFAKAREQEAVPGIAEPIDRDRIADKYRNPDGSTIEPLKD